MSYDFGDAVASAAEKPAFGAVGESAAEHLEDMRGGIEEIEQGWAGRRAMRKLGERVERGPGAEDWRAPFDTRVAGLVR